MFHLPYILFFIGIGIQLDWIEQTQELTSKINNEAILTDTFSEKYSIGQSTISNYQIEQYRKLHVNVTIPNSIDLDMNYYVNDGFIFCKTIKGTSTILYKRDRLGNEPYAKIIELHMYFKNNELGVETSRELDVFEGDDIEALLETLHLTEFTRQELDFNDYIELTEDLDQINSRE